MEAKELRLGNWILEDGKPLKVSEIRDWYFATAEEVPLTPEILEKAGFEKTIDGYRLTDDKERGFIITFQEDGYVEPWIWILSNFKDLQFKRMLDSVHKLQNFWFTLTGEELPIEL